MPLSGTVSEQNTDSRNFRDFVLVCAAAAVLMLAPAPAFAQHGGGGGFGGGGGHAGGGGGFGGGGHSGGGGGGHSGSGGGGGSSSGGSSSGGGYQSAHGSAGSNGGGHWWSGIFGGHSSNGKNEAPAANAPAGKGPEGNSQASIAAQRAFQNAVAHDNLVTHNTWQDPPPEFSGQRIGGMTAATAAPRGNSILNARPFSPVAPHTVTATAAPRAATTVAPISPRGRLGGRYGGYPYYYYYPPYYYGGLGYGFFGGYGFGCGGFWGGWGWGNCFGGGFGFGPYDGFGGYGYYDGSSGDTESSPNYQVFSGGADSPPDDSGGADTRGADNEHLTYQNAPQDTGVAADQSTAKDDQPFVLYLKDGSSYAVTRYWVAGGNLHYVTSYGGENTVALDKVNVQKTVDENAALGHPFTLTPGPDAPGGNAPQHDETPASPPSQGPPPSMDGSPSQYSKPAPGN